jgi:hypothetical protein
MSSVFIAYNEKKISKETKRKISYILDYGEIKDGFNIDDYRDLALYKKFGKIQIIYPESKGHKFNIFKNERYLIAVCGLIHNEHKLLKKYNYNDLWALIIDFLKQGNIRGLENFFINATGQFSIFIFNFLKDEIFFINDKLGLFPSYYLENNDSFIYASRAEAIIPIKKGSFKINYNAVADFLSLGIVQNRETFLQNINNLPAASILRKKSKSKSKIKKYYEFEYDDNSYSRERYLPIVNDALKKSVLDLYLLPKKGIKQACLTGGFDTRLMNSILLESGKKQTVTFTRHHFDKESEINKFAVKKDEEIGKIFASKYGLKYNLIIEDYLRDVFKQNKKQTLELHGLFGGELFGGEAYNQPATLFNMKIPASGKNHFLTNRFKNLLTRDSIEFYYENVSKIESEEWKKKVFIYKATLVLTSFFNSLEKFGNIAWEYPLLFFKDDSLSGAKTSLYPYLDADFLKVLFKIPYKELQNRKFYSAMFEKYYSKYLSVDVLHGKKRYYRYNKNTKKLYIHRKIEEEMEKQKNREIVSDEERREKGIKDFLHYLKSPVNFENFDKGFFFFKEVSLKENDLLYHRIKKLQKWFKDNIY